MSATLLLVTISASHYCEKARWALQRAGLAFHEEAHVPGFARRVARGIGGKTSVPVLLGPHGPVTESTDIVRLADEQLPPDDRLFTGDPEVDALVARFDKDLGPHTRRVAYSVCLPERALALRVLSPGVPRWERWLLTLFYPFLRRMVEKGLKIDAAGVARSRAKIDAVFADVAERLSDGRRFLTGDTFTAADLTFASLAALVLLPPQYGARLPALDEWPAPARELITRMRETPAGAFALRVYAEQRGRLAIGHP